MVKTPELPPFKMVGGLVCLDFLNTLDGARGGATEELLTDYANLLRFSVEAGLLDRGASAALTREATARPRVATKVVRRAIELREALYRVIAAAHTDSRPPDADVECLNRELSAAMAHARLCATGACWEWGWEPGDTSLERVLWPIAHDAARLLTSPDLERVSECGSDACTWVFLDTTKNHRRRWCQMEVCGNRAKARRHRARTRRP